MYLSFHLFLKKREENSFKDCFLLHLPPNFKISSFSHRIDDIFHLDVLWFYRKAHHLSSLQILSHCVPFTVLPCFVYLKSLYLLYRPFQDSCQCWGVECFIEQTFLERFLSISRRHTLFLKTENFQLKFSRLMLKSVEKNYTADVCKLLGTPGRISSESHWKQTLAKVFY